MMIKRFFTLAFLLILVAFPLTAQTTSENFIREIVSEVPVSDQQKGLELDEKAAIGPIAGFIPGPPLDPAVNWREMWICRSGGPAEVQGYQVQCTGASFLDFHIADCCLPGDHWQLKGKNWDTAPNTGVTTAPGPANTWGVPGRVYNYGGTPFNPGNINTYVECTYPNGVDVFLADSFVNFSSDGVCTVTPDTMRRRIDRTP